MSITESMSPSKESINNSSLGSETNLPRDFSKLSLFSSGSTTSQDEHYHFEGHAEHSLSCMRNYLQSEKLCDITLIAGNNGKRIAAHRLVLSAASEYFSAMFTGNLKDAQESEITLVDVGGDTLQTVINYCYTGSIEIREDNVETLLSTACLMLLHEVVEACSSFLANQLRPYNCLGIAVFAEHQACSSLLEDSKSYISEHFMQVIEDKEFLQLDLKQMLQLLKNEDLNIQSEENVFQALMTWIRHDSDERMKHLGELLGFIKLPLLSPEFLADEVEPVIGNDSICQQLIMDAMKWHLLPKRRLTMISNRTSPRKGTLGRILAVGGMDIHKGATTIESYDPRTESWLVAYHMTGRRLQFGIALMDDKLLIVGGRDGLKTLNSTECLHLKTGAWTQLAPMNTHRHGINVGQLGGSVYAMGGHDGWSYLNTVERWDPMTRTWHFVAPMHNPRCSSGVATLDGKLYVVGGRDGAACLKTVECYDPHANKWTHTAPLSRRCSGLGCAVANGFIYAIGGQDAPANNPGATRFECVERYDPRTDTWTTVAPLPEKRDTVAACLFGDKIFAIGGYDGGTNYLRRVESYDPITNQWESNTPLITGRAGACVIAVSNSVLAKTI